MNRYIVTVSASSYVEIYAENDESAKATARHKFDKAMENTALRYDNVVTKISERHVMRQGRTVIRTDHTPDSSDVEAEVYVRTDTAIKMTIDWIMRVARERELVSDENEAKLRERMWGILANTYRISLRVDGHARSVRELVSTDGSGSYIEWRIIPCTMED